MTTEQQMTRRDLGPREIMGQLAYQHAVEVTNPSAWLMIAGHESRNAEGRISNKGDIAAQAVETVRQIKKTVTEAGWKMSDIVQMRIFVTDIEAMTKAYKTFLDAVNAEGISMTSTMIEVPALSDPDMMIEIDAIAVR